MRAEAAALPSIAASSAPTPAATFASSFDPAAYLAHARDAGVVLMAHVAPRGISWDISRATGDLSLHHHPDPCLDLARDPENLRLLWEWLRAEAYLAAVRACGLVIVPWRLRDGSRSAMIAGEAMSGERDFSAGTLLLLEHVDGRADRDCREGLVFLVLCAGLGLDPDDPALNERVDGHLRASHLQAHARRPA